MRGHIKKRGKNSWSIVIDRGRDSEGKRRQTWITVHGRKGEAEDRLTEELNRLKGGMFVEPSKQTVSQYLESWLKHMDTQGKALRTLVDHRHQCRQHLIPALGDIQLQKLTAQEIEDCYADSLATGRLTGKGGLSARTVAGQHRIFKKALARAVKLRLISRNPCDDAEPPSPVDSKARALEDYEMSAVLRAAKGARVYGPIYLALSTGLRKGEILALKWKDIDGDNLTVNGTVEQAAGHIAIKQPKTKSSRRTIALPQRASEELRKHRAAQNEERLLLGSGYQANDLVFPKVDGQIWAPTSFDGQHARTIREAGIGHVRFHWYRHTHASQLLKRGENIKVVSERLGHAKIGITLDTYGHLLKGMQESAAKTINDILAEVEKNAG